MQVLLTDTYGAMQMKLYAFEPCALQGHAAVRSSNIVGPKAIAIQPPFLA